MPHKVILLGDLSFPGDLSTLKRIISQTIDPLNGGSLSLGDFEYEFLGRGRESQALAGISARVKGMGGDLPSWCIVALGDEALQCTAGYSSIDSLRGYVFDSFPSSGRVPVIGTYSAERIRKGSWHLARVVQLDLLKAIQVSREGRDCFKKEKTYELHPSPAAALRFLDAYRDSKASPLAFDIETPYGGLGKDELMGEGVTTESDPSYTIERISFAFKEYEAVTVPWSPPYIDFAKALLAETGMKLVWNEAFDVPRLMANGVTFGGPICDVMHAWHFLEPSLPMGLKYVSTFLCPDMPAWKLMSREEPEWYSAADSDTLLRCFVSIQTTLRKQERWIQFERHFLSLKTLLNKMTLRGITVDQEKRKREYEKLLVQFNSKVEDLQGKVPIEILPIHPKRGFKKDEAFLKKKGSWNEGRMVMRSFELTQEEEKREYERLLKKEKKEALKEEKRLKREEKKEERRLKKEEKERQKADKRISSVRRLRRIDKGFGEVE